MAEKYRYGRSVVIRDIYAGSFFYDAGLHYKTDVTKDNGKFCLCHPVTGGQYGNIIQDKINVWMSMDETVSLAMVTDGEA